MSKTMIKVSIIIVFLIVSIGTFAAFKLAQTSTGKYYLTKVERKIFPKEVTVGFSEPKYIIRTFNQPQLAIPAHHQVLEVKNVAEAKRALELARKNEGDTTILFHDGFYDFRYTINITRPNIHFKSVNQDPYKVVFKGLGAYKTNGVHNLIKVSAAGFVLDGITLRESPNHLIQIAGEDNADAPIIRNCIMQDSMEQMIKTSYDMVRFPENTSDFGVVENCIFEFTRGIAFQYYTGGIDCIACKEWRVENNIFRDIASPSETIAQYAVHFWTNSSDSLVKNNIFINNDRSIGFGMFFESLRDNPNYTYPHARGEISRNFIIHTDIDDQFSDVGIGIHGSPETVVKNNYIYLEHNYPNAIEVRYPESKNVKVIDNLFNKSFKKINIDNVFLNNNDNLPKEIAIQSLSKALDRQKVIWLYSDVCVDYCQETELSEKVL